MTDCYDKEKRMPKGERNASQQINELEDTSLGREEIQAASTFR
jgi:hypothetical protein